MKPTFLDFVRAAGLNTLGRCPDWLEIKAAVPSAATGDPDYSALVGFREFQTWIERRLLPARIEGLVRVPFDLPTPVQATGAIAYWRAEGAPRPITGFSAESVRLKPRSVEAVSVATSELLLSSEKGTGAAIVRLLGNAVVAAVNTTFLSAVAEVADTTPGGIAESAPGVSATSDIAADLASLVAEADDDDVDLSRAVWITSPSKAVEIAAALHTDKLGLRGGELLGGPALTDPGAEDNVFLLAPDRIALALGLPRVEVSSQATIQMSDTPDSFESVDAATVAVSLWQTNRVAFLSALTVNWQALAGGVYVLSP